MTLSFFKIFLFMRERERQRHRQREKQDPCREPDVGLDPRSLGSHPGLKAGAKLLSHLGCPVFVSLLNQAFPLTLAPDFLL